MKNNLAFSQLFHMNDTFYVDDYREYPCSVAGFVRMYEAVLGEHELSSVHEDVIPRQLYEIGYCSDTPSLVEISELSMQSDGRLTYWQWDRNLTPAKSDKRRTHLIWSWVTGKVGYRVLTRNLTGGVHVYHDFESPTPEIARERGKNAMLALQRNLAFIEEHGAQLILDEIMISGDRFSWNDAQDSGFCAAGTQEFFERHNIFGRILTASHALNLYGSTCPEERMKVLIVMAHRVRTRQE